MRPHQGCCKVKLHWECRGRSPLPEREVSSHQTFRVAAVGGDTGLATALELHFLLAICQEIWYYECALRPGNTGLEAQMFTWGCRVSTGEQVEELQVEVSVRTLVKQPTNNRCQTGIQLRSRCLRNSKRRPPIFLLWGWSWASTT